MQGRPPLNTHDKYSFVGYLVSAFSSRRAYNTPTPIQLPTARHRRPHILHGTHSCTIQATYLPILISLHSQLKDTGVPHPSTYSKFFPGFI